jgi:hypothetical protein
VLLGICSKLWNEVKRGVRCTLNALAIWGASSISWDGEMLYIVIMLPSSIGCLTFFFTTAGVLPLVLTMFSKNTVLKRNYGNSQFEKFWFLFNAYS